DYTIPELITDVLIDSQCAQISNITWSTGTNFNSTNGIGYFNKSESDFPFDYGIVLTTGSVLNAPGPNTMDVGDGAFDWPGDAQLTTYLESVGIAPSTYLNATILEFDFIPLIEHISFDFIFASEEYGNFQCDFSDAFAFFLTNTTTGVTSNLAVLPSNPNIPISVVTIRDNLYNGGCGSGNREYFGAFYGFPNGLPVMEDPIVYNGMTIPMVAEADVVPGTTYHIKLVIQDRGDSAFDSAVFLNGGSFSIGDIELGADLLVNEQTALCEGAQYLIESGLDPDDYDFVWYLNDEVIVGETGPDLLVTESGEYMVEASYTASVCTASDSVIIEFYPPVVLELGTPEDLYVCDDTATAIFDLTQNTPVILDGLNLADYTIQYFETQADAEAGVNPIMNPELYEGYDGQTIYVLVTQITAGCTAVLEFDLHITPLTDPQVDFSYPQNIFCSLDSVATVSQSPVTTGG